MAALRVEVRVEAREADREEWEEDPEADRAVWAAVPEAAAMAVVPEANLPGIQVPNPSQKTSRSRINSP